jgi:NADPH:quinone reductase-like Zn-dependent oxidoreductase
MRAYLLPKAGAGIDALVKLERPEPRPAYRQVLVKVAACSLNFRDLSIVRGTYPMPVADNLVPLSDGAGEVVEVGAGVRRVRVGDKVAGCFFQRWPGGEASSDIHATALGGGIDGMLAEYVVLEEDGVVRIPSHLSLEEGATLPCAAVTAWHAIVEHGKLIAGDTVLLQGTGGVSIFGLQLAHAMGVMALITSSSDEKLTRATELGAQCGVNYRTTSDWDKAAVQFTDGRGVDQVLDVGGAGTFTRSFGAIRVGGKISLIGSLRGHATELNPRLIVSRRANVQRIVVGSMQMFEAMNRAVFAHKIRPVIDRVFDFDDVRGAFRHMDSAAHFGKIVIRVA